MGVVYSPEQVAEGSIPAADGSDQIAGAALLMNYVRSFPLTSRHAALLIPGSTATGQATRRSDVDFLLVDDSDGLPQHRRDRQQHFIRDTLEHVGERYGVQLEGQRYTRREMAHAGHGMYDAFWLAHALDIQRKYPDWSHRQPLEGLHPYAIGFEPPRSAERVTLAAAISLRYMANKTDLFGEAGELNPNGRRDLLRYQRALEAPKAYARKMLAVSALEGCEVADPDVTSRENMQLLMEGVFERIGSAKLRGYNDRLVALDAEYDEVLDEAATSGDVTAYSRWLSEHYLPACGLALQLGNGYLEHINDVVWTHPDINFWHYGVDVHAGYDEDYALHHSSSGPLEHDGSVPATLEPMSAPILVNMHPEDIDTLIRLSQDGRAN